MADHQECSGGVETAIEIIVGKWKPVILYQLMSNGTKRFSELKHALPGITQKMLTAQLRELESHDIIQRKVYAQVPPKVEYSITTYGLSLMPIMTAMHEWGLAHLNRMQHKQDAVDHTTENEVAIYNR